MQRLSLQLTQSRPKLHPSHSGHIVTQTPQVPFTIAADLELAGRVTPYINEKNPDVRIFEDDIATALENPKASTPYYEAAERQFLVKADNGLRFLVENGETIRYARPPHVSNREVMLFLLGSAWGALAYQRGLLPIHASAVINDGNVFAFSGESGAGKSTLTAALSQSGHAFFSDDVLIIDPRTLDQKAVCYAGQKDLKLWRDALEFVDVNRKGRIRDDDSYPKYYADPSNYSDQTMGILKSMYLLTCRDSEPPKSTLTPITGGMAINRFNNTIYRYEYGVAIVGQKQLFRWLADLMQHVTLMEFDRPADRGFFPQSLSYISEHLKSEYSI